MKKRPTLRDVAELAGVSRATAARVVNGDNELVREQTRERVLDAVNKLKYERHAVAGSLRSDRTYMVALSIPDITNPFWPEVARGVQDTVEQAGYTVALLNSDWNADRESKHLRRMRQGQYDGLIINPTGALLGDLTGLRLPVVILGVGEAFPALDTVGSDTRAGVQAGLEHLWELGHRRIGLIAGRSAHRRTRSRFDSYVLFHARHGLVLDDALIVEGDFTDQDGFEGMRHLLALDHPPTAVFAANDIIALGALKAARALNVRVPEDVSIIGMDDIHAAALTSPALTTVAKPKYDIGVRGAHLLLQRMQGETPERVRHDLLPCSLIIRDSTAPPAR
ncbi:MAG TPA: LacI family DNA-binding transcriptional regulator [Aggregatilineales bacterium]|nr:LacI family DNA-binding transcriptional regulator [Aggregatilineales bacterium]